MQTVQLIAPYFSDFVLEPQEGNEEQIILKWQQKGCEDIFNASQLSDGTLRFICLATLLLQPHELQSSTIIVDEPELGLHPYAITIFALIADADVVADIQAIRDSYQTPEHINNSPETAPSKRVESLIPNYAKIKNGTLLSKDMGIDIIMEQCPHFREWIQNIISLNM